LYSFLRVKWLLGLRFFVIKKAGQTSFSFDPFSIILDEGWLNEVGLVL
jgi:hypothetical protein